MNPPSPQPAPGLIILGSIPFPKSIAGIHYGLYFGYDNLGASSSKHGEGKADYQMASSEFDARNGATLLYPLGWGSHAGGDGGLQLNWPNGTIFQRWPHSAGEGKMIKISEDKS